MPDSFFVFINMIDPENLPSWFSHLVIGMMHIIHQILFHLINLKFPFNRVMAKFVKKIVTSDAFLISMECPSALTIKYDRYTFRLLYLNFTNYKFFG